MDIANLRMAVQTQGVKQAINDIKYLGSVAKKTSSEAKGFSSAINNINYTKPLSGIEKLKASLSKLGGAFNSSVGSIKNFKTNFNSINTKPLQTDIGALSTKLIMLYGAFKGASGITSSMDLMTNLNSRLKLTTSSTAEFITQQKALNDIAFSTSTSLEGVYTLYTKLSPSLSAVGLSTKETTQVVENFSKALKISGTSTQEANAAILQFSQAMASGKFAGDEFRSVAENAPKIMDYLGKALGVSRGELRKLSSEGKLTAESVANAFLQATNDIQNDFLGITPTISGSLQNLSNSFNLLIDKINETLGISKTLSGFFNDMADIIAKNKATISDWADDVKDLFNGVLIAGKALAGGIVTAFSGIASIIGLNFDAVIEAAKKGLQGFQGLLNLVVSGINKLGGNLSKFTFGDNFLGGDKQFGAGFFEAGKKLTSFTSDWTSGQVKEFGKLQDRYASKTATPNEAFVPYKNESKEQIQAKKEQLKIDRGKKEAQERANKYLNKYDYNTKKNKIDKEYDDLIKKARNDKNTIAILEKAKAQDLKELNEWKQLQERKNAPKKTGAKGGIKRGGGIKKAISELDNWAKRKDEIEKRLNENNLEFNLAKLKEKYDADLKLYGENAGAKELLTKEYEQNVEKIKKEFEEKDKQRLRDDLESFKKQSDEKYQIALNKANMLNGLERERAISKAEHDKKIDDLNYSLKTKEISKDLYNSNLALENFNYQKEQFENSNFGSAILDTIGSLQGAMGDFFNFSSNGFANLGKFAQNIIASIANSLISNLVINPLLSNLTNALPSLFGGISFNANGGVYASNSLSAYSNSIVSSPTPFFFARGGVPNLGVMGEAGSEAILPLKRINGELGVMANVGGGNMKIEVINNSNVELKVSKTGQSSNGKDMIVSIVVDAIRTNNQNIVDLINAKQNRS